MLKNGQFGAGFSSVKNIQKMSLEPHSISFTTKAAEKKIILKRVKILKGSESFLF